MLLKLILIISFLLIPSYALAWGPLTHIYLGSEVFYLGSILPAGIYTLLRRYRHDYLYGNLMADIILGKKYLPPNKHSHNWDVANSLLESSETDAERAFSYGYMSHLAADTVAHARLTDKSRNLGHAFLELKADRLIDRKYWFQAIAIDRKVQKRNDIFLEKSLDKVVFSFKTNRRIFKGWVILSGINKIRINTSLSANTMFPLLSRQHIKTLHEASMDRIIDVLQNGTRSEAMKKDPIGNIKQGRLLKELLR